MEDKKFPKIKKIPIAIQKYNIRKKYKDIIKKDLSNLDINMILQVQPTEHSPNYETLLEYKSVERKPKVYVALSQLDTENSKVIPHKYCIKEINNKKYVELCLFYKNEWNPTMNIADTIIPWVCEWLYFYEIWVITGEWCGGGKHPTTKDIKKNDKE